MPGPSLERTRVAEALLSMGGSAVREEADRLITYLREGDAPADLERAFRARLGELSEPEGWTLRARPGEHRNWRRAWKRGLGPRRVGDRWLVAPSWFRVTSGAGARVLRIDPGAAFGTGEHGTTRGMLRLLAGGVLEEERATVVRAAREANLELVAEDRDEGWWSGRFEVGREC